MKGDGDPQSIGDVVGWAGKKVQGQRHPLQAVEGKQGSATDSIMREALIIYKKLTGWSPLLKCPYTDAGM